MARPTKQGIDYFPMDCTPDHNLEMFIAETGAEGFGILIMVWQRIYRSEGYYISDDDDLLLILKRDSLSTLETVKATLETAIKRGLFSRELHDKYGILTSTGIQKRYFQAARQKKQAHIYEDFRLIDVSNIENVVIGVVNPVINDVNATNVKVDVNVKLKGKENSKCGGGDQVKTDQVEALYKAYPRKIDKAKAVKAISAALKSQSFEMLLDAVKRYAEKQKKADKQFIPYPATWFNGQRWLDEDLDEGDAPGADYVEGYEV